MISEIKKFTIRIKKKIGEIFGKVEQRDGEDKRKGKTMNAQSTTSNVRTTDTLQRKNRKQTQDNNRGSTSSPDCVGMVIVVVSRVEQ